MRNTQTIILAYASLLILNIKAYTITLDSRRLERVETQKTKRKEKKKRYKFYFSYTFKHLFWVFKHKDNNIKKTLQNKI